MEEQDSPKLKMIPEFFYQIQEQLLTEAIKDRNFLTKHILANTIFYDQVQILDAFSANEIEPRQEVILVNEDNKVAPFTITTAKEALIETIEREP